MRRTTRRPFGARATALTLALVAGADAPPAHAQSNLSVRTEWLFYGDNTEFHNPFREGETLLGAAGRLYGELRIGERVDLRLGIFANQRFGGDDAFELVRPVVALIVKGGRSRLIFGTLDLATWAVPTGPDRQGPHGLLPPMQRETLSFDRAYEAGLQWTFAGARLQHEVWINWQQLNTPDHRERFDTGLVGRFALRPWLAVAFQTHVVHHGGQLFSTGPVADSVAVAPGLVFTTTRGIGRVSLEAHGFLSHHVPDRQVRQQPRDGAAIFARAAVRNGPWRGHWIVWRACDYAKAEGDSNYFSLRLSGARYRGTRDYSEVGLARTFRPAPDVTLEASARLHRIERHYEYSYRILASVRLTAAIR
ncbi:MAG: hypothetical protein LC804_09700 [Acidobacteria bacterium]|nr:hypothetical protein [Acidobacteriota bacterium]